MSGSRRDDREKRILSFAERCQQRRKENSQMEGSLASVGGTMRLLHMPDDVFLRLGGKPTAQEATWTCATCGEVAPRQYTNGYVPGRCACQEAERKQREEQQRRLEVWQHQQMIAKKQCAKCYTWLGPDWSDPWMEHFTFDTFDDAFQPDAFLTACSFAEDPQGNLVFWSDESWGTGKTHLAAAICNAFLARNVPGLFSTAQNMFNAFAARMDDHHGYSDLLAMAGSYPLLVIDDLDKVHLTSYKQSIFFEVLDKRYKRRVPTVITTNARVELAYNDVAGISDYIGRAAASRLTDEANGGLMLCEMNGEDFRRRKR